jgi:hypothetical protein
MNISPKRRSDIIDALRNTTIKGKRVVVRRDRD